jgi:hypothetical protein
MECKHILSMSDFKRNKGGWIYEDSYCSKCGKQLGSRSLYG